MLSGTFQRKLQHLNPRLRIYCGNNDVRPAMVEHIVNRYTGETEAVCGVDKNELPELPIVDQETGQILRGGWRRALDILISKGLIDRRKAEAEFCAQLANPGLYKWTQVKTAIELAERDADERGQRASIKKFGRPIENYRLLEDEIELNKMYKARGLI